MATTDRSLAHWSEEGRREMEAFYALARLDYEVLAKALDWPTALREVALRLRKPAKLTLLDVACGSGKFPAALLEHGDIGSLAHDLPIAYDLLDPSAFSLEEAARELAPPFLEGAGHEVTLEDLDPAVGPFDVVWATHALYAMDPAHVTAGIERFLAAIAPGGFGVIAQGARPGHYHRFYEAYLADVADASVVPYVATEDLIEALRAAGAQPTVRRLTYDHVVADADVAVLEGYLQRCAFDDSLTLEQMRAAPTLGAYLEACHDAGRGEHRFTQQVDLILLDPPASASGGASA